MRLNKGQAMEAMTGKVLSNSEVASADAKDLRLMDYTQLQESAYRVLKTTELFFINAEVNPRYVEDVLSAGAAQVVSIWRDRIHTYEESEPSIVAERQDRGFRFMVDRMVADAQEELAKFNKRYAENPLYAFEWGTDAVQAAANQDVALRVKAALDAGHTREEVIKDARQQLGYALRLSGSTSPMSNLAEQAKAIAYGKIAGLKY